MKLSELDGIGPATQKKLRSAGIRSVKDLATVDTRDLQVDGVSHERLQGFKKDAQKALYQAASSKVVASAKRTGKAVAGSVRDAEAVVRKAVKEALEAAWEAEHRAIEAIRAQQNQSDGLAHTAAERAKQAQRVAQEKTAFVMDQLAKAPEAARGAWNRYGDSARQAEENAVEAAKRAASAAAGAGRFVQKQAATLGQQSKSFISRLKRHRGGSDNGVRDR